MSREVDERVVELQMHNKDFEDKARQSIETLNKLDQSLQLDGSGKGLSALQNAVNNFTMISVQNAVEGVTEKFSMMERFAIGAFERMGAKAADTAERYMKMFTVDNLSAGWQKFGEKTTSVATLVSQLNPETGENYSLEEVNEQLEKLNWFTDETSYNFTDMVSNISKFTATGQKLETSVDAMQGIALWASRSGQGAVKASQAMYQLSQAMGKGALKYDDFKSIQNASMDTQEFRGKAIEAAKAAGILSESMDDLGNAVYKVNASGKTFSKNDLFTSDALSKEQWFTSDVMMDTFNKYSAAVNQIREFADANDLTASEAIDKMKELGIEVDEFGVQAFRSGQEARTFADVVSSVQDAVSTGWMHTFEDIFGNYEEARDLWTAMANELYDIFAEPLNKQNIVLDLWKKGGGRDNLIAGFSNLYQAFKNFILPIKNAWEIVFPPKTHKEWADALLKLSEGFANVTKRLAGMFDLAEKGSRFFLDPILKTSKKLRPFEEEIKKFAGFVDDAGKPIGDFADWLGEAEDKLDEATEAVDNTVDAIANLDEMARSVINGDWGNGQERIDRLREAGYNFELIQNKVNELLGCSYRYEVQTDKLNELDKEHANTIKEKAEELANLNPEIQAVNEEAEKSEEPTEEAIENAGKVERIFLGLVSAIDLAKQVFQASGDVVKDVGQYLWEVAAMPAIEWITDRLADLGDALLLLDINARNSDAIRKAIAPLGDALKGVIDFIAGFIKGVWPFVEKAFSTAVKAIGKVKDMIKQLFDTLEKNGVLERVKNAFKSIWDSIKEISGSLIDNAVKGFDNLGKSLDNMGINEKNVTNFFTGVAEAIEFLAGKISEYKDKIVEFFKQFTDKKNLPLQGESLFGGVDLGGKSILENVGEILKNAWTMISTFIQELPGKIQGEVETVGSTIKTFFEETFKDLDFENLGKKLKGAGIAGVIGVIAYTITNFINNLGKVPKSFSGVLDTLSDTLSSYQNNLKADTIEKVGKAILFLAAGIFLLALIDTNKLQEVAMVLGALMVVFMMVVKALTEFKKIKFGRITELVTNPLQQFFDGIVDAFKTGVKIAGFGILMAGIGAAIWLIVKTMQDLAGVKWNDIKSAVYLMLGILGALLLAGIIYNKFSKDMSLGSAVVVIAFALSMKSIAKTLMDLTTYLDDGTGKRIEAMIPAAVALGALMLAMGAAVAIASAGASTGKMLAVAVMLWVMCKAMKQISASLKEMTTDMDAKSLVIAAVVLGGMLTALAAIAGIMGANAGVFAKGTVLLVALIAALYGLIYVLTSAAADMKLASKGLILLAGALAIFIAAAFVASLGPIAEGLIALSVALIAFGLSAVLVAASAYIFGAALTAIGNGFADFFEGLADAGKTIQTRGGEIATAIGVIFIAVASAIIMAQPEVAEAIISFVTTASESLVAAIPTVLGHIWLVLLTVITFLIGIMPELVDKVGTLILSFLNNLIIFAAKQTDKIRIIIENLFALVVNIVLEAFGMVGDAIAGFFQMFVGENSWSDALRGFADGARSHQFTEFQTIGEEAAISTVDGYKWALKENAPDSDTIADGMIPLNDLLGQAGDAGDEVGLAFNDNITEQLEGLTAGSIDMSVFDQYAATSGATSGATFQTNFADALSENGFMAEGAAFDLGEIAADAMGNDAGGMEAATTTLGGYTDKMGSNGSQNKVASATRTAVKGGTSSALSSANSSGQSVGKSTLEGILTGLKNGELRGKIDAEARAIPRSVLNTAREELGIKSPSKKMIAIYKYVAEGAAIGLRNNTWMVKAATEDFTNDGLAAMRDGVAAIAEYAESGLDTNPTITPVMDLSQIQNGTLLANSMLSGLTANVRASGSIMSVGQKTSVGDMIKNAVRDAVTDISAGFYGQFQDNSSYTIEVPLVLDGREVARATAPYTKSEIARIDRNIARRGGNV